MADSRRGRNRPDSRAWDEPDRRSRYGGSTRDRRDDRDRYRDDRARSRDRRQRSRSRSRSPISEPRERHRSRSRDRRDRARRRGYESSRGNADGRHNEREKDTDRERDRERDGRRHDGSREDHGAQRGQGRRGDPRRSASPPRSPVKNLAHSKTDEHSPLPTRSKNADKSSGPSSVKGDIDQDDSSRKSTLGMNRSAHDTPEDDQRRGRKPKSDHDGSEDAMDEDDTAMAEDDEMSAMQSMMGFGGFGSTKGQKVPGNNAGGVYKAKKTEYRQYMNRVGGFNRPLSPGR